MRLATAVAVALLLSAALVTAAAPAWCEPEPDPQLWPRAHPVESPLRAVHQAWRHRRIVADLPQVQAVQRRWHRAPWQQARIAVELLAAAPALTRDWSAWLARRGGEVEAAGDTLWLVWLPPATLPELSQLPGLQVARLPWPLRSAAGPTLSDGTRAIGAVRAQCGGSDGSGASVVVVDSDWHGLNSAIADGEIVNFAGKIPFQDPDPDSYHGTACAEVIADIAPGASIMAQAGETASQLQVALPKLAAAGVQVVSLSGGWSTGWSFGDGTGPLCALVNKVDKQGVVWINAAGNEADGKIWHGTWTDADSDGWHEFSAGKEVNKFYAVEGYVVELELDWDAYPVTGVDLDLFVCSSSAACTEVAASKSTQDGGQSPWETVLFTPPSTGSYYVAVRGGAKTPAGLRLRVVIDGSSLAYSKVYGTLTHPADCAAAVAVGAVDVAKWSKGKPVSYSSRGPTFDGRVKPDLVAPTGVQTSQTLEFSGTSAACPHVAGAVALLMQRDGLSSHEAVAKLLASAEPAGDPLPNNDTGMGKLRLLGSEAWCLVEDDGQACTDACGASGLLKCAEDCAPRDCAAPSPCATGEVDSGSRAVGDTHGAGVDAVDGGSDAKPAVAKPEPAGSDRGCEARPGPSGGFCLWPFGLLAALWLRRSARLRADRAML
ncbi:MAG: S8 family serine peptidase [Deltaproteobacteria bacterium]|nr:S8 family serine peptidase [Deltaproteobacteria bacterium]